MPELKNGHNADLNYITVSTNTSRITVRKAVLEQIGSPEHIVFLTQDDGKAAMIRPADKNDNDAIRVTPSCYSKTGMFQFGGKILVGSIRAAMKWDEGKVYRVRPKPFDDKSVLFEFSEAVESTPVKGMSDDGTPDPEEENTTYYWKDTRKALVNDSALEGKITESSQKPVNVPTQKQNEPELDPTNNWVKHQFGRWGWNADRYNAWSEEAVANTGAISSIYLDWRNGKISQEEFLVHHKELEQMDYAFELGRRVSIVHRIRSNMKAFNTTMMAIIYDEKIEVCEEILETIKQNPYLSDFDLVDAIHWET